MSESNFKDIVISLPQQLLNEVDKMIQQDNTDRDALIHQATERYVCERHKYHIRETMRQGYMEMANINLNLSSEAFHAEEEAEYNLNRHAGGV